MSQQLLYQNLPQGNVSSQPNLLGNLPQGIGGEAPPPIEDSPILATYPPAADVTYEFYKFYQINKGQTQGNESNVPLVISVSLPEGSLQDLTNGFDVRVFDSAGSPTPYEIIDMVVNGDGSADFILWSNMPLVNDLEFFQLAFGKAEPFVDGSTPNLVYDSNYTSVYHLNGVGIDSTVNAENMTINGTTTVPAKIGTGLNFPGTTSDYLIRNPYDSYPTTEITAEFWLKTTGTGDGIVSYSLGTIGQGLDNEFLLFSQNILSIFIVQVGLATGLSFNDGIFHHMVVTWRSSDGQVLVYDNKNLVFTGTNQTGEIFTNNGALVLGQEQDTLGGGFQGAQSYNGILEEVKLSNSIRNADYVFSTFNNQNDNDAFWFNTPRLVSGEDNFEVDDMGNNIVAELS